MPEFIDEAKELMTEIRKKVMEGKVTKWRVYILPLDFTYFSAKMITIGG